MFAELCVKLATEHGIIVSVCPVDGSMLRLHLMLGSDCNAHYFDTKMLKRYGCDIMLAHYTEEMAEELLNYVEKKMKENVKGGETDGKE